MAALAAVLVLGLTAPAVLRADTDAPLFGPATLTVNGTVFTWDSATESGTNHVDAYVNDAGGGLTVTGVIGAPTLAAVTGTTAANAGTPISGYLASGSYGDLVQSSSVNMAFNGRSYDTAVKTYAPDLANGRLNVTGVYSGDGGTFTVAANGSISGSEGGVLLNGDWLVNSTGAESGGSYQAPAGGSFTAHT